MWLTAAFGFETVMVIMDAAGNRGHSAMHFGADIIMVGNDWTADHKSPASIAFRSTPTVHVHLTEDIDKHGARATAAGAVIVPNPKTRLYGDRIYRARDPEGPLWTVAPTVKAATRKEAETGSGLRIQTWV